MAYAVVFGILGTLEQTDQYSMNLECANFGQIMTFASFYKAASTVVNYNHLETPCPSRLTVGVYGVCLNVHLRRSGIVSFVLMVTM